MEESTKRWVSGCAFGCAAAVALVVLVLVAGYLGIKKMVHSARKIEATTEAVTERYGRITDFRPPASGTIAPERVEVFLQARELTRPERERLAGTLASLSDAASSDASSAIRGLGSIRAGLGLMPQTMRYLNRRSEALLEAGMGLGEYLYLYTIAYPCWLGTPVDDGPPFVGTGTPERWQVGGGVDDPGERQNRIRERLHAMLLPMLRNQLEDLLAAAPPGGDRSWTVRLRGEIEHMEHDPRRLPWQDGLPEATATSLEPFHDRLEASYDPLCHPVELAVQQ